MLGKGNINVNQFSEFHRCFWHLHDTRFTNFLLKICIDKTSNCIVHKVLEVSGSLDRGMLEYVVLIKTYKSMDFLVCYE